MRFHVPALTGMLLRVENRTSNDRAVFKLALRLKSRNSCMFTVTGRSKSVCMHMYRCVSCEVDVCSVCAEACHAHSSQVCVGLL